MPWLLANLSCRHREAISHFRDRFARFQANRDDPKRQGLTMGDGFLTRKTIHHHAGQIRNIGDPTTVFFLIEFNFQDHDFTFQDH